MGSSRSIKTNHQTRTVSSTSSQSASPTTATAAASAVAERIEPSNLDEDGHLNNWMVNLRDEDWLIGPRKDTWYTGKHPNDTPGMSEDGTLTSLAMPRLDNVTRASTQDYFDNTWTLYEMLLRSYGPGGANEVLWAMDKDLENPKFGASGPKAMHMKNVTKKSTMQIYKDQRDRASEAPHPWSLASHCFNSVFEKKKGGGSGQNDQSIIITGESGSGKTFTTMKVLDYLAEVGGADAAEGEMNITDLMLSATPILEGFGNANMPRNPDSSRFGKLYKIFFSKKDQSVTGCSVTPYVLEKSRVSAQQMNERNFHIFYRMLCHPVSDDPEDPEKKVVLFGGNQMGFSPEEKEKYHMLDPAGAFNDGEECRSDYNYLNGGHTQANTEYIRLYRDAPGDDPEKGIIGFQAIPAQ